MHLYILTFCQSGGFLDRRGVAVPSYGLPSLPLGILYLTAIPRQMLCTMEGFMSQPCSRFQENRRSFKHEFMKQAGCAHLKRSLERIAVTRDPQSVLSSYNGIPST
jgi:hypothetical protein